ncbi:hypothetical protein ACJRO7_024192 [Eucalyptus globulus]|uniref:RNase H type-1 domain-containing protein n=1 Tax=Eucalyptus globulus TaxID=34317 RepID=A0ABD3KBC9_EUCGL
MDRWVSNYLFSGISAHQKAIFAHLLWLIWKARNTLLFQGRKSYPTKLISEALLSQQLYEKWNPRKEPLTSKQDTWVPPDPGSLKLNVDCSWQGRNFECSVAGICRGANGICIDGFAQKIYAQSACIGETLAILQGLLWLKQFRSALTGTQDARTELPVTLSSDCLQAVDSIMGRQEPSWASLPLVLDC